jgi:hypothetical protein
LAETSQGTRIARTRYLGDSVDERPDRDRNGTTAYGADPSRGTGMCLARFHRRGASEVGLSALVVEVSLELYATALRPASPVSLT